MIFRCIDSESLSYLEIHYPGNKKEKKECQKKVLNMKRNGKILCR